jgi:hypothetical protein
MSFGHKGENCQFLANLETKKGARAPFLQCTGA